MKTERAVTRFAKLGGAVVMEYFRKELKVGLKGTANLVSEADFASERTIVQLIRSEFPDDAILAEEEHSGTKSSGSLWIIDPLDGTNNFAHGIPHFAISIAYYEDGVAQCGAVFNPARDDLYVAQRGAGAYWNGRSLRVSNASSLDQGLIGTGFHYDRGEIMRKTLRAIESLFESDIHGIRRFGTASLDLCSVASGEFAGFFEYYLSPWDFAAGRLIVEEAGGRVTDCGGAVPGPLPSSIVASNGHVHAQLLDVLG